MEKYKNLSESSGVIAYEILDNSIVVHFQDKKGTIKIYEYSAIFIGKANIEAMKLFAYEGRGLGTFISTNKLVRNNFKMLN